MAFIKNLLLVVCLAAASPAAAHEFWIEPESFHVAPGQPILARTMIGSNFLGEELANYASMQRIVDISLDGVSLPVSGPEERTPSLQTRSLGEGLNVLRYQSRDFQVTYDSYDKWLMFLDEAQRRDLIPQQDALGTRDNIREVYFRYVKSLVAVGDGQGEDTFMGMPLELVALTNPYQDTPDGVRLRVYYKDEPAADAAVHVFIRDPQGAVTSLRLRTDPAGEIYVPTATKGMYMVNTIQVLPASPRMRDLLGASWQSLWASTTYEIR